MSSQPRSDLATGPGDSAAGRRSPPPARLEEPPLPTDEPSIDDLRPGDRIRIVVEDRSGGAVVVSVTGEVDLHTVDVLHSALADALAGDPSLVVVDLDRVEFLSSRGMSALVELRRAAEPRGIVLRLVGEARAVTRPLQVAGLVELFSWHPTVAHALQRAESGG